MNGSARMTVQGTMGNAGVFRTMRLLVLLPLAALLMACGGEPEGEGTSQALAAESAVAAGLTPGSPRASGSPRAGQSLEITEIGYNNGDPDAPVKVIELSDFGCGYCRVFAVETYPTLYGEYIETGKVEWKFVPTVLGRFRNSIPATFAAECAGEQGMFNEMHWRLFQDQQEWKSADDPDPVFQRFADEEGMDVNRFNTCIAAEWRAGRVRDNMRLSQQLGVRGTPTFVIDGFPVSGALPLETFRDIFEIQLGGGGR